MDTQAGTIICRTGWCGKCAKEQRPQYNQRFMAVGEHGYHLYYVETTHRWYGFTPHLYQAKIIGDNVVYERLCCMENCGVEIYANEKERCFDYFFNKENIIKNITTLKNWNALVMYKNDQDYFI